MKRKIILQSLFFLYAAAVFSQEASVESPNHKISIGIYNHHNTNSGQWYLTVNYIHDGKSCVAIPQIDIGLLRSDQDFSTALKFLNAGKPNLINDQYNALHGKRSHCSNSANEIVVSFENPSKAVLNLIIRAYNDGVAFRYEFPDKKGTYVVKDELTAYTIPSGTKRWMEKWNRGNEELYSFVGDENVQQTWSYPALFNSSDTSCWFLIHEADVNRSYCGTKLSNQTDKSRYKLSFPDPGDGEGDSEPTITLPWRSPWRVIILGSLADIVGSTLVNDVSAPSVLTNTDWIKPGIASWNYWSHNHGTKDYINNWGFVTIQYQRIC